MGRLNGPVSSVLYIIFGIVIAVVVNQGMSLALMTDMPIVAVESNSMIPTFQKGDILILQGASTQDILIGDIIVFSPTEYNVPIVHRVIAKNPDGTLQTKGDANSMQLPFEKSIAPEQIHGRGVLIVPHLGWIKIGMTEYLLPNLLWVGLGIFIFGLLYIGSGHLRRIIQYKI